MTASDTTDAEAADATDTLSRLTSLEAKIDQLQAQVEANGAQLSDLTQFARQLRAALAKLEDHPMLGKLFGADGDNGGT